MLKPDAYGWIEIITCETVWVRLVEHFSVLQAISQYVPAVLWDLLVYTINHSKRPMKCSFIVKQCAPGTYAPMKWMLHQHVQNLWSQTSGRDSYVIVEDSTHAVSCCSSPGVWVSKCERSERPDIAFGKKGDNVGNIYMCTYFIHGVDLTLWTLCQNR